MHENIVRLKAVASALKGLKQSYAFVGGATVSLYATNPELSGEIRPTDDIDVVVELASYNGYAELDEHLRSLGFTNDVSSGVICRYMIQGIIVDVMPTDPAVIVFSNRWYPEGFKNAVNYQLDEFTTIQIFSLPYLFASKWEAFKGRGNNDYRTSKDFEDMVYVIENTDDFEIKIQNAPEHLKLYLRDELKEIINRNNFEEGIYTHLTGGYGGIDAHCIRLRLKAALNL